MNGPSTTPDARRDATPTAALASANGSAVGAANTVGAENTVGDVIPAAGAR